MNPNDVYIWVALANGACTIGTFIYAWLTSGSRANTEALGKLETRCAKELDELDERLDTAEERLTRLEGEFKHLPDRASVAQIQVTLAEMKGEIHTLNERMKPMGAISERLQDFLLEAARQR